jgi:hypothetical protein
VTFWREFEREAIGPGNVEAQVMTFFDLCHAAEIGNATGGRRGHPARLCIYRDELEKYLIGGGTPQFPKSPTHENGNRREAKLWEEAHQPSRAKHSSVSQSRRVFVSHGCETAALAKLGTTLDLAGLESSFVRRTSADGVPISDPALREMKQCHTCVVVITDEDCEAPINDARPVKEPVLIEIGAAYAQFDGRIVLLADHQACLPNGFSKLTRYAYHRDMSPWEEMINLVQRIKTMTIGD